MIEVWKENYIAVKRKDEVENLKKAEDLNFFKTNYVVIGPVSSSLQISTVNEILNQHKVYLSYHAVVLTLRPLRVGGTTMKFKMYRPPPQYDEVPVNLALESGDREWMGASASSGATVSAKPFWVQVEHALVNYELKLYRLNSTK